MSKKIFVLLPRISLYFPKFSIFLMQVDLGG